LLISLNAKFLHLEPGVSVCTQNFFEILTSDGKDLGLVFY